MALNIDEVQESIDDAETDADEQQVSTFCWVCSQPYMVSSLLLMKEVIVLHHQLLLRGIRLQIN